MIKSALEYAMAIAYCATGKAKTPEGIQLLADPEYYDIYGQEQGTPMKRWIGVFLAAFVVAGWACTSPDPRPFHF
jgi:hypothetical protein